MFSIYQRKQVIFDHLKEAIYLLLTLKKNIFLEIIYWPLEPNSLKKIDTVGENSIATTKIRNNYVTIQSLIFPILDFSLLLLASFLVSILCFFFDGSL